MCVALNANVPGIIADCGGAATCATCHVYIDADWLEKLLPPSRDEAEMILCAVDPDERSRWCKCPKIRCKLEDAPALAGAGAGGRAFNRSWQMPYPSLLSAVAAQPWRYVRGIRS